MTPAPGERLLRFVGDKILFTLRAENAAQKKFSARLRTNLGRAAARRAEILAAAGSRAVAANSSWRDVPMQRTADGWQIELPLAEVGFFKAKAYLLDDNNWQHWPDGGDVGISVHPHFARTANTIYCAFTRLFGATKNLASTADAQLDAQLKALEAQGYATLPPSGTFRDLIQQLPHIVQKLGCKIIHLLPVHPTPTTYARFGRFGSPYAALDLTAVDPALVEFDKRTTGIDQFCELTQAAHALDARVFIDIVINHTGWGSTLQENHPHFFLKKPDGEFASPGAWGTVWEDLVELEQHDVRLWDIIADSLLTWCRRGVDGFRCDAGYKIPTAAWQYIIARVQEEFPEAIFLLEGLGGSWDATESLLTDGGMQWAYSELFQNYSGKEVAWYLDYANKQNERVGSYIHYSETHDNDRLAKKGRTWSLLRNRLCALTSPCGGFAFTCGVEWLATEKIRVHGNTGLNWGAAENIVPELAKLNELISNHPCFFDGAKLKRISGPQSPIYALLRESEDGEDTVLILANTDLEKEHSTNPSDGGKNFLFSPACIESFRFELLGQQPPLVSDDEGISVITLPPGAVYCLGIKEKPVGLSGDDYRRAQAQAAWAVQSALKIAPPEIFESVDWEWLVDQVARSPKNFLTAASEFAKRDAKTPLTDLLSDAELPNIFPRVITWTQLDTRRITMIPPDHWLLIEDEKPFRATLQIAGAMAIHVRSIPAGAKHIASFAPQADRNGDATLSVDRAAVGEPALTGTVRFLAPEPAGLSTINYQPSTLVLLTNNRGGMARLCVDVGRVNSKYDCALGANLHASVPVDRHVFVKRIRVWVNADGFISALDFKNLAAFQKDSGATWDFIANAGDGRTVEICLHAEMVDDENTVVFQFSRPTEKLAHGKQLPAEADVRLTVRVDIEDRSYHAETKRNPGAEHHFNVNTRPWPKRHGFEFTPAPDRQLWVYTNEGIYHPQVEWCENIPHPVEQTRGQMGCGDAFSPGWFELPLTKGAKVALTLTTESNPRSSGRESAHFKQSQSRLTSAVTFEETLAAAAKQFVVQRDDFKTVIAGYPWFLDWGRDSLICARGLLAAGLKSEVKQILITFARFEKDGTLPNTINGNNVSNRDTTDAPLWFAVVCEDLADKKFFHQAVGGGRTIYDVLVSIAENYMRGTPNGIHMDADSSLVWSPSHFTWMDTNYPAATPREGYPVEIQALWIRLLQLLAKISPKADQSKWHDRAEHALASFRKLFWLEEQGWFADVLLAKPNVIARDARPSDALRNNCLFAISLGLVSGERAKRCVAAAEKYLLVPGGLRSLAPLPVQLPLPVHGNDARLINDPNNPYWPRYEGDEDTRRKPAYHNGTAWTWTFPAFCEALVRAWDFSPEAVAAAKSYLGSAEKLLNEGCLGQLPEILDGDAPHTQRGCDAQAWGATEALRVWKFLAEK